MIETKIQEIRVECDYNLNGKYWNMQKNPQNGSHWTAEHSHWNMQHGLLHVVKHGYKNTAVNFQSPATAWVTNCRHISIQLFDLTVATVIHLSHY